MRSSAWLSVGLSLSLAGALPAEERGGRFDLGLRGAILLGQGQPANDMVGEALVGRFRVHDAWYVGVAVTTATFDYETPNRALGIAASNVVDGSNEFTRTSVFVERRYESARNWDWYWTAGIGVAKLAPVANVAGPQVGGGTFDIVTTADDETHVFAGGGLRRPLGEHWALDTAFTLEHHGTDYRLVERVSGRRATLGAHSPYGLAVGASYRF